MHRLTQAVVVGAAGWAVFQSTVAHAGQALGVPLGTTLGTTLGISLPFAGGGVLAVAAAAVVGGIFVKHRKG